MNRAPCSGAAISSEGSPANQFFCRRCQINAFSRLPNADFRLSDQHCEMYGLVCFIYRQSLPIPAAT
ncbi:hypothetical protein ABH945_002169 [Paraburkholderia sp. GAS333]